MSIQPHTTADASDTVFFVLYSMDGSRAFNKVSHIVETFDGPSDALGKYGNPMTDPLGFGAKEADWPSNVPNGDYRVTYYIQSGATPVVASAEPMDEWLLVRRTSSGWAQISGDSYTAPAGGGNGGTNVAVTPILAGVAEVQIASTVGGVIQDLDLFQNSRNVFQWVLTDGAGQPLNVSGHEFKFVKHSPDGSVAVELDEGNITTLASRPDDFPDVLDIVQVTIPSSFLTDPSIFEYKAWDMTLEFVFGSGKLAVRPAPKQAT